MSHPFVRVIFLFLFLRLPQAETGASLCVGKLAMEGGCHVQLVEKSLGDVPGFHHKNHRFTLP